MRVASVKGKSFVVPRNRLLVVAVVAVLGGSDALPNMGQNSFVEVGSDMASCLLPSLPGTATAFFGDLTGVGVTSGPSSGCLNGDCTNTDKFTANSTRQCALACNQLHPQGCNIWFVIGSTLECTLRRTGTGTTDGVSNTLGPWTCIPPDTCSGCLLPVLPPDQAARSFFCERCELWGHFRMQER